MLNILWIKGLRLKTERLCYMEKCCMGSPDVCGLIMRVEHLRFRYVIYYSLTKS